jgi:LacI family repressor for deo operon, udp, cdd, tsx, nupC, and nupG
LDRTRGPAERHADEHANMSDVASAAGVSVSTVSRALRGKAGVSEATREKVRATAARLSYVVSPEASALARRSTGRVGVAVPHIGNWFCATMLAGLEPVLRRAELDVLIYHLRGAADRDRFFERLPVRRKVDALVLIALPLDEAQQERLDLLGTPVVVAGGRVDGRPHVAIDDVAVGRRAVEHLVALGHERIAMIRSRDHEGVVWPADHDRALGYRLTLQGAGLEVDDRLVVSEQWGPRGGRRAMARLLDRHPRPTAVFAVADEMALGAIEQLRRAGLAVPEDVSVIGVDEHPMSEPHDLTTIRQPVSELGATAGRMVVELLGGAELAEREVRLPTELVVRATTGPVTTRATTG